MNMKTLFGGIGFLILFWFAMEYFPIPFIILFFFAGLSMIGEGLNEILKDGKNSICIGDYIKS